MYQRMPLFLLLLSVEAYSQFLRPSWSSDGTQLVFDSYDAASIKSVVYIVNSDGSNLRKLADGNSPSWMPDGRILFRGEGGLYTINSDGGHREPFVEGGISVSPDGKRILFIYSSGETTSVLKVNNVDGSGIVDLYTLYDTDRLGSSFLWSPDGSKIAFLVAHGQGITIPMNLYLIDTMSGESHRLLDNPSGFTWSPDSKRITFVKNEKEDNFSIYEIDVDTREENLLVEDGVGPSWSPDGKKMAFASRWRDGMWDIYLLDTERTTEIRLTEDPDQEINLVWSPDGTRIAFMSDFLRDDIYGVQVHILEVEGGHRVTAIEAATWGEIKSQFHK